MLPAFVAGALTERSKQVSKAFRSCRREAGQIQGADGFGFKIRYGLQSLPQAWCITDGDLSNGILVAMLFQVVVMGFLCYFLKRMLHHCTA